MRRCLVLLVLAACRHHAHVAARDGDVPRIAVIVRDPGADPEQIERAIVVPIERAVADMAGVAHVTARIAPGVAHVELELERDADPFGATSELQQRIPLRELPSTVEPPFVVHAPATDAVLHYVLRSEQLTAIQLRTLEDWTIRPALERLPGIPGVETCGGAQPQLVVEVDPAVLAASGLTLRDVATALTAGQLGARGGGRDQLANRLIAQRNGAPIYVRDVARVVDGAAPVRCRAFDERGPVVTGTVRALARAAEDELHESAAQALAAERAKLPAGTTLVLAHRGGTFAVDAAGDDELATLREVLAKVPGVEHFLVEQGAEPLAFDVDPDRARVVLAPRGAAPAAIAALRARGFTVHDRDEVIVQIVGPDRTQLLALAKATASALAATTGIIPSGGIGLTVRAALEIVPDTAKLANAGVDARQLGDVLRAGSEDGLGLGSSFIGEAGVPIVLRIGGGREQLLQVSVRDLPLASLVDVVQRSGLAELRREDREPWVGVAVSGDADAIEGAMARVAMPAGYRWRLVAGSVDR